MKPRMRPWKNMWECYGYGLHSLGYTPTEAFTRWQVFVIRMKVFE